MGKYSPLTEYLRALPRDTWTASFEEIEKKLNFKLPPSARKYNAWWSNSYRGNHSQCKAWIDAGWHVDSVNRREEKVVLSRSAAAGAIQMGSELQDLWRRARELSGIEDREALEREVIGSFIRERAGKRLIALGGAMKDASAPNRRQMS